MVDGQNPGQPRTPLRIAAGRQSYTGVIPASISPKPPPARSSSVRVSSPGALGALGNNNSPIAAPGSPGFGPAGTASDLPRLPCVSETGEKNAIRPPASVMLRRASTVHTMNVHRDNQPGPGGASRESPVAESTAALKRERNSLRIDKGALIQNKKRLEALVAKLLEQPLPGEEDAQAHSGDGSAPSSPFGSSGGAARSSVLRSSALRAQMLKVLDESIGLDKQLGTPAAGGATAVSSADLTAKMAEMKAEHELVVSRLESELSYRRTQATAATAGIQKQLTEAHDELSRVRQQLAAAEVQIREFNSKGSDLREQVQRLNGALAERTKQLADARDMLGMDKKTMATVIDMLKEQIRDANADRAAKARHITELEYAIVHRDNLLTEAHERINQAAAQAAAAAAAGVSSSAAVARVAASMATPLDSKGTKGAWGTYNPTSHGSRMGMAASRGGGGGGLQGSRLTRGGGVTGDGAGHLSRHDSYSGELFEAADMED